jgi:predicted Rossmann fold nucleotide-binding protein DprA/Smf involved in DNA uptake
MTNRDALILLCSQLSMGHKHKPFTHKKISQLIVKMESLGLQLKDLANRSIEDLFNIFYPNQGYDEKGQEMVEQIYTLLSREGSMAFAMMELRKWGIDILTKIDDEYPQVFLKELGVHAPSLFYYSGNLQLFKEKFIGFTGSRLKKLKAEDELITKAWAQQALDHGYGIVSGGATGIDTFSTQVAIKGQKLFIEWLSDSLIKRLQITAISLALQNKNGLLISEAIPSASFNVGMAMARNKYIYLSAEKVIAVKAEYTLKGKEKSGGTWNGAIENLRSNYKKLYVVNVPDCLGNRELIELGATAIPLYPNKDDIAFLSLKKPLATIKKEPQYPESEILTIIQAINSSYGIKLTKKEQAGLEEFQAKIQPTSSLEALKLQIDPKLFKKIYEFSVKIYTQEIHIPTSIF